ncbi:Uncharacterized protein APZ42_025503 [Daphnia magna]|uniref:Uncharacterized protein n=1 Tax=Daphnia magna TaxID=35525 RepID=A0A164T0H8_9CRUS|nr:Uncharacterized protein APZ42_025503 [Daphnia magna]
MLFKENVTDSSHQNTENHLPSAEICVDATSQRHPTPVFDDNYTRDPNASENAPTEPKDDLLAEKPENQNATGRRPQRNRRKRILFTDGIVE